MLLETFLENASIATWTGNKVSKIWLIMLLEDWLLARTCSRFSFFESWSSLTSLEWASLLVSNIGFKIFHNLSVSMACEEFRNRSATSLSDKAVAKLYASHVTRWMKSSGVDFGISSLGIIFSRFSLKVENFYFQVLYVGT